MLDLSVPWWEFVVRGAVVYIVLMVLLRMAGKRQTGQLATFDLVLLLVLSNAVQNAMNAGDNSLLGGLILAVTLIGLHYAVAYLCFLSPRLAAIIDGRPKALIQDGCVAVSIMRQELVTQHDLDAALRAADVKNISDVDQAMIENSGQITVCRRRPAT